MAASEIRTVWATLSEQCEVAWSLVTGYRTRLWVEGRLVLDEWMADADAAVRRAWELRTEWPAYVR